jgi:uncharacterized membrane protein YgcG
MRPGRLLAVIALAAMAFALGAAPASAGFEFESIPSYDVTITINDDGTLTVHEVIAYDFGSQFKHGIFRDIPVRFDYPKKADTDRVYEIDVESVKASEGTPAQYELEEYDQGGIGYERIKIGDPDETITGERTYDITYTVKGALNGFEDHDELYWNAIGHQWSVTIDSAAIEVRAPTDITQAACFAGPLLSTLPCAQSSTDASAATFAEDDLFPFNGLTVVVGIPKGAVPPPKPILEERWTPGRAFALNPATGGVAGGMLVLLVGGFLALYVPRARDRRFKGSAVDQAFTKDSSAPEEKTPLFEHTETPVEFVPPDDLRPGQVGTLADFQANPLDVTATIVDLAVRKYLVIEEVETESRWLGNDWKLTKLKVGGDELKPYERELMDGLFRDGDDVQLSDLKYEFASRMGEVRKSLMDDAMEQGWFTKRPDGAALGVGCLGFVVLLLGVGLTIALAAFTHAGLLGIPVIILGLVMIFSARFAPARTAKGSAAFKRVNGFRRFIEESEKERAQFAEKKNLFSEYLPYAIVFGATEKWARAFEGLGAEPEDLYWYRSSTPFHYMVFSDSITGFSTTSAGTLTSTPPSTSGSSGFSGGGGGFSGGGGGGGGGGSW